MINGKNQFGMGVGVKVGFGVVFLHDSYVCENKHIHAFKSAFFFVETR